MLSDCLKVTQLVSGAARIGTGVCLTLKPGLPPHPPGSALLPLFCTLLHINRGTLVHLSNQECTPLPSPDACFTEAGSLSFLSL